MKKRLSIIDSSLLCVLLQVPGKDTCGDWDLKRTRALIEARVSANHGLVLPYPAIVEVGNHIAKADGDRYGAASRFVTLVKESIAGTTPWVVFGQQKVLFEPSQLNLLLDQFPIQAASRLSLADLAIVSIAKFYRAQGYQVEVLTGDDTLRALAA